MATSEATRKSARSPKRDTSKVPTTRRRPHTSSDPKLAEWQARLAETERQLKRAKSGKLPKKEFDRIEQAARETLSQIDREIAAIKENRWRLRYEKRQADSLASMFGYTVKEIGSEEENLFYIAGLIEERDPVRIGVDLSELDEIADYEVPTDGDWPPLPSGSEPAHLMISETEVSGLLGAFDWWLDVAHWVFQNPADAGARERADALMVDFLTAYGVARKQCTYTKYADFNALRAYRMFIRVCRPGSGKKRRHIFPKDFVLHSARHTCLTRLGEAGADAFTIMKLAGHSSVTVSQRYVHPTPEAVERAFDRLEALNRLALAAPAR